MSNLHLEAIKARAQAATPGPWRVTGEGITNLTPDKAEYGQIAAIVTMHPSDVALLEISDDDAAHIAGMDPTTTLALIDRIERLEADWLDAVTPGEWAAPRLEEPRERLKITDDMIERAANAIWYGQLPDDPPWEEQKNIARHALEAALKEESNGSNGQNG